MRLELAKQEAETKKADAELAAKTEQLNEFTQGLAQQQQGMARQMQAAVTLNPTQIDAIGNALKPFAGQKITLRMTMDSTSARIAAQLNAAFKIAGIEEGPGTATYAGATYQGINVVIQKTEGHPPLADAVVSIFHSLGIPVNPVVEPTFPADLVTICIGPQ
jgi:hypothetical protein